jgi:hypothetical protein
VTVSVVSSIGIFGLILAILLLLIKKYKTNNRRRIYGSNSNVMMHELTSVSIENPSTEQLPAILDVTSENEVQNNLKKKRSLCQNKGFIKLQNFLTFFVFLQFNY